jgi:ribonuclease P protein component
MKKKNRVRTNFSKILAHRISREGGLTVFAVPGRGRIGVAVAKSVKGAVKRNRIKRHLREFAHDTLLGKTKMDVILVAGDTHFSKKPPKLPA